MVTGGVPLFDFPHRAGVLSPGTMAWITSMRNKNFAPEDSVRDDWNQVLKHRPIRDIPLVATGNENPFWNEWMEHEYYDGYWHRGNFLVNQHKIDLPALYVTGWYDDVGPGSMQIWDMNKRNGRKNQKLVCGPWMHKMNVSRDIHNINYGPDAVRYDMFCMYMRWYDHFLKGVDRNRPRGTCGLFCDRRKSLAQGYRVATEVCRGKEPVSLIGGRSLRRWRRSIDL